MNNNRKSWIGFVYGLPLSLESFLAMGDGHGTYIPAGLVSAPLGLMDWLGEGLPLGLVALLIPPIMWWAIYYLINNENIKYGKYLSIGILAIHYIGAFVLLTVNTSRDNEYNDWDHLIYMVKRQPSLIILLIILALTYIIIQYHGINEIIKYNEKRK